MSSHVIRNPGFPLNLTWVENSRVNLPAVKRRADTLKTRRSIKKQWQAAWLLRAVSCIDLTTLAGDDTSTNVSRLCFKAQNPIRKDLLESMGMADERVTTGAVCVYLSRVDDAVHTLKNLGSKIPVASVAAGFPAGKLLILHLLLLYFLILGMFPNYVVVVGVGEAVFVHPLFISQEYINIDIRNNLEG